MDELERLRSMNEFKTQFLNVAAQELNTPLTPIRVQIHLLKGHVLGELNDRQGKAVDMLERNVQRLENLVKEVLDVARLQSGRLELALRDEPLEPMVQDAYDAFNEAAEALGIHLATVCSPELRVRADRSRIQQVLYSLVSNAIKFTPAGGTVELRVTRDGNTIRTTVTDSGAGLQPDQMARLFRPFSQVHDPLEVPATGSGLGLYICKGIIKAHGGALTVQSRGTGQGCTFAFTLPTSTRGRRPSERRPPTPFMTPIVARLRELI